jgi:hypothetical protein
VLPEVQAIKMTDRLGKFETKALTMLGKEPVNVKVNIDSVV